MHFRQWSGCYCSTPLFFDRELVDRSINQLSRLAQGKDTTLLTLLQRTHSHIYWLSLDRV